LLPGIFVFCGKGQQSQIHEKLLVQGIAVDFDDNEYNVHVQSHDFKNPENKDQPSIKNTDVTGQTLSLALGKLKKVTGLTPLYSQNLIVLVGEEAAKKGLDKFLDFFVRYYENRLSVNLRVTKGKAKEFFDAKDNDKLIKAATIKGLANENADINILNFERDLKSDISDPVMLCMEKDEHEKIICKNLAVFSNDKLSSFLDKEETIGAQILRNVSKIGIFDVNDYEKNLSCTIESAKTEINAIMQENRPMFEINSKISVNILEFNEEFKDVKKINEKIKPIIEQKAHKICETAIKKTLISKCDIFKFGKILRNKYPKYFKNIEKNWKSYLPVLKCKLKIQVDISVIGTG
jgi:spore germination protein KC/spore germination protein